MKPTPDEPLLIPQRQAKDIEPAVDAIGATMSTLNIVCMPLFMCLHQSGYRALHVVRVNDIGCLPHFQFFKRPPEVFERCSIEALNLTRRRCNGNRDRNAFDNLAEKHFNRIAVVLSSFLILMNFGGPGSFPTFLHVASMVHYFNKGSV